MSDLAQIEGIAGALLRSLQPSERRRILRAVARDLRKSQSDRIARQQNPDGSAFAPRKQRTPPRPGNSAVKFMYPKGAANPRLVLMKSWVHEGPLLTGFDIEAGGIRSFFWDKVDRWLAVDPGDQNRGGGRLRRRGGIRRAAMFRKMRSARHLKSDATDVEAWVGFAGRASEIASVSQLGLRDRPAAGARPVAYVRRELLGFTDGEVSRMLVLVMQHLDGV